MEGPLRGVLGVSVDGVAEKRLPRWGGWADDSSPGPLASREIPAARRTGMRLNEIKLRLPMREMACRGRWACSHIGTFVRLHICD